MAGELYYLKSVPEWKEHKKLKDDLFLWDTSRVLWNKEPETVCVNKTLTKWKVLENSFELPYSPRFLYSKQDCCTLYLYFGTKLRLLPFIHVPDCIINILSVRTMNITCCGFSVVTTAALTVFTSLLGSIKDLLSSLPTATNKESTPTSYPNRGNQFFFQQLAQAVYCSLLTFIDLILLCHGASFFFFFTRIESLNLKDQREIAPYLGWLKYFSRQQNVSFWFVPIRSWNKCLHQTTKHHYNLWCQLTAAPMTIDERVIATQWSRDEISRVVGMLFCVEVHFYSL